MTKNEKSRPGVIYGRFSRFFGGTGVYYDNSLLLGIAILIKNDYLCTSDQSGRRSTFVIYR